jgi:hypothetical protein
LRSIGGTKLVHAVLDVGGDAMLGVLNSGKGLSLHLAAWKSTQPAVVALLLARGPAGSARAVTAGGCTPLYFAANNKDSPAAKEIEALLRSAME